MGIFEDLVEEQKKTEEVPKSQKDIFEELATPQPETPPPVSRVGRNAPPEWLQKVGTFAKETALPYLGRTAANIPSSAWETGKGLLKTAEQLRPTREIPIPGGQLAKNLGYFLGGGIQEVIGKPSPDPEVRAAGEAFGRQVAIPIAEMAEKPSTIPGRIAKYVEEKPVEAALNILPFASWAKGAKTASEVSKVKNIEFAVKKGWGGIYKGLEKKPQLPKDITKAMSQASNTVVDTIQNKNKLTLINEAGEEIISRTPKSIAEQAQAVEQGLERTGKEIERVMESARIAGAGERPTSIVSELHNFARTEAAKLTGADKYAIEEADKLVGKKLDIKTIHDMKRHYNDLLKSDYSHDIVSRKEVDRKLLQYYRDAEDRVIDSFTGEDIKPIRDLYRDYKSIQKDVMAKYRAELSKEGVKGKGLIDLTDIYSVGEVTAGILSAHPLMVGKGLSFGFAKKALQRVWSVDRKIVNMYESVERNLPGAIPKTSITGLAAKTAGPAEVTGKAEISDEEMEEKIRAWLEAGPK